MSREGSSRDETAAEGPSEARPESSRNAHQVPADEVKATSNASKARHPPAAGHPPHLNPAQATTTAANPRVVHVRKRGILHSGQVPAEQVGDLIGRREPVGRILGMEPLDDLDQPSWNLRVQFLDRDGPTVADPADDLERRVPWKAARPVAIA